METKTQNSTPVLWVGEGETRHRITFNTMGDRYHIDVELTTEHLQSIVQQAYDTLGILASPSIRLEVDRAAEAGLIDTAAADRAFADAWALALRGKL